jgi:predicted nucleic acid-binding protein
MVTDLFYIIHKETHDTEMTYRILENIFKLTSIMAVTEQDIADAFEEKWRDFEDCVQFTVAKNNKIDCIITGNAKDYTNSSIPVMSPMEYLQT